MIKSRLNINGTDVGFLRELPISLNKSVADIRDPNKRDTDYTKTIVVPGTPEVNQLFEYCFKVTSQGQNFNPNLKTPASYYVNEVKVFEGGLQLLQINRYFTGHKEHIEYECSIIGDTGNLFIDIAGSFLHDLDLSDLDHAFTYASGLFNPTLGEGYCYPYIDYGLHTHGIRNGNEWFFEHLKPAVFEKEYIDRIFSDAGYTYTSNYLNSTYEKSIIIPCVNEGSLQKPASVIQNNQFLADGPQNNNVSTGTLAGVFPLVRYNYAAFQEVINCTNDSTGDGFDPGGVYNTGTFVFTVATAGTYNLHSRVGMFLSATNSTGSYTVTGDAWLTIQESINGGSTWATVKTSPNTFSKAVATGGSAELTIEVIYPNLLVSLPHQYRILFEITNLMAEGGINAAGSNMNINYTPEFGASLATLNLTTGDTVVMKDTIPRDVSQLDFLTSIMKAENLYIERDPQNYNNYIIEPREEFIEAPSGALDWTSKLDLSKPIKILPMGEMNAKRYTFSYKSDKDYYNKIYEEQFKEVYGTEIIDVNSDFVNEEKRIELVFSATPIAQAGGITSSGGDVDIIAPRFWDGDPDNVKPMRCNIRRLYWGGMIDCTSHRFYTNGYLLPPGDLNGQTTSGASSVYINQYPFCGHVDHPINPTVDLNFDNPYLLYWNFPQQTFTNNDRYGARYSKFISEITDRDSKIVLAYFNLSEYDIASFSFRKMVFVEDSYYFVNAIKDYDPQFRKTTLVELLKLKTAQHFIVVSGVNINDQWGGGSGSTNHSNNRTVNANPQGNYGPGLSVGFGNLNGSPGTLIIGNKNIVG